MRSLSSHSFPLDLCSTLNAPLPLVLCSCTLTPFPFCQTHTHTYKHTHTHVPAFGIPCYPLLLPTQHSYLCNCLFPSYSLHSLPPPNHKYTALLSLQLPFPLLRPPNHKCTPSPQSQIYSTHFSQYAHAHTTLNAHQLAVPPPFQSL